jgi:hypothetical protein
MVWIFVFRGVGGASACRDGNLELEVIVGFAPRVGVLHERRLSLRDVFIVWD